LQCLSLDLGDLGEEIAQLVAIKARFACDAVDGADQVVPAWPVVAALGQSKQPKAAGNEMETA